MSGVDALPARTPRKEITLRAHELAAASSHAVRTVLLQDDAPATATAWLLEVVTSAQALMSAIEREQAAKREESGGGGPTPQ